VISSQASLRDEGSTTILKSTHKKMTLGVGPSGG